MRILSPSAVGPVVTVVLHGSTAGTARPTDAQAVLWVGTVQPTNATASDVIIRTDLTGDLSEQVRDIIASALVAGSNVTITPNDGSDTITIAASGGGSSGFSGADWAAGSGRVF